MKTLILGGEYGSSFERSGLTEAPVTFRYRFVDGQLPAPEELAFYVAKLTDNHEPGYHWATYTYRWHDKSLLRLSLFEVCELFETVELWFDPAPNDQLQLVWLLDLLGSHPDIVPKLKLRLVDFDLVMAMPEHLANAKVPVVNIGDEELKTASTAWQAFRSATPQACFDLLTSDLSALPQLKPALLDLLEELPSSTTGLGATELRLLELIAAGYWRTFKLLHSVELRQRRVFKPMEIEYLLEELAHCPVPAISGLDEELRTLGRDEYAAREAAHKRSRLTLTEFGKAILTGNEDFSRHNPIDRWWGGTHLTNDNLWRWNPALVAP